MDFIVDLVANHILFAWSEIYRGAGSWSILCTMKTSSVARYGPVGRNGKRAMICAIIAAVFAACGFTQTPAASSTLTILFHFDSAHSQAAFAETQRELGALMEPAGFRLEWRDRDGVTGSDSFADLAVVDFRGRCLMEAVAPPLDAGEPLAKTHVTDGKVLPFSEVHCDQVRASLHSAGGSHAAPQSNLILGRAMARVLAHELYHILTRTMTHQSRGIAKRSMSPEYLVSDQLDFPTSAQNR